MSPEIFFQIIVNGLFTGGIYSLVAVGLTLIYGVMIIVNFAHGEFLMVGMYTTFLLSTYLSIEPLLTIPAAATVGLILGVASYCLLFGIC